MALEIIATFGKFFLGIFKGIGGMWKVIVMGVGLLGWRWSAFIFIALVFLGHTVGMAVQEQDPTIVINSLGNLLLSTDKAIETETVNLKEQGNEYSPKQWFWAYLTLVSNLYLMYFWFWILFKLYNTIFDQSDPVFRKFALAMIIIILIRTLYVAVMVISGAQTFQTDYGESYFRLIFPFSGLVVFFQNITVWTTPLINLAKK